VDVIGGEIYGISGFPIMTVMLHVKKIKNNICICDT